MMTYAFSDCKRKPDDAPGQRLKYFTIYPGSGCLRVGLVSTRRFGRREGVTRYITLNNSKARPFLISTPITPKVVPP